MNRTSTKLGVIVLLFLQLSVLFSAFGRPTRIEFQTMSQPGIVLTGAGLALAFGFILLKIPGTRHVLTFLLLSVAMALVGIWHFEPVQLLLQPAVIGVLLAFIAAVVETRIKHRQRIAFITLAPPSDVVIPGSSRREPMLQPQVESAVGP